MGLISKIEDKLSSNKGSHTEEERLREEQRLGNSGTHNTTTSTGGLTGQGSHLSHQSGTTTSGLTGSSHPIHGTSTATTTGVHNPLSSENNTYGSSGITGGTHPLVNDNKAYGVGQTSGLTGQGRHFAGHDDVNINHSDLTGNHNVAYGSGLTDTARSGTGIGSNTHSSGYSGSSHTGTGLGSNTHHTGSGITGSGITGSGITGGTAVSNVGSRDYAPGTHSQGMHNGITSSEKTTARHSFDPYSSREQNITADATHEGEHTGTSIGSNTHHTSTPGNHDGAGFVPGSHPRANNDSAIPTAGGQKVGSVGEGVGHSHSGGVHETTTDKIKNVLPGQHNAHDAYGNPIKESGTGAHTSSSQTGSHNTGTGITGNSHGSSNLTGTHGHSNAGGVTGGHTNYSHPNQPGSGFSSAARPLGHDSSFTDRHTGPGAGTGLAAGAVGGAGLVSAGHHNSHNTHQSGLTSSHNGPTSTGPGSGFTGAHQDEYTRGQQAAYTQQHGGPHNTTSGYAGEDNRGIMDKVKDKISSKRSDQPDDPVTGTDYDQKNRGQYTRTAGPTGSPSGGALPGSHTQGSGLTGGNHTYGSDTQQPGVGGITSGVDNTHIGSGSHSGVSHEGRGAAYEAGFKDAAAALQSRK